MKNGQSEAERMNVKTVWAYGDQESPMEEPEQEPDNSLMQVISGEVWYRERIALPPDAEVIVTLSKTAAQAISTVSSQRRLSQRTSLTPYNRA